MKTKWMEKVCNRNYKKKANLRAKILHGLFININIIKELTAMLMERNMMASGRVGKSMGLVAMPILTGLGNSSKVNGAYRHSI